MRHKWGNGEIDDALAIAKIVAPYVHPRRTMKTPPTITPTELHRLTDEELSIRLAAAQRGARNPPDNSNQPDRLGQDRS